MDSMNVHIVTEYKMPPVCCACGDPSGPAKFRVYASSWSSRRPFAVNFPLCPACEAAYNAVDRRRRLGCWIGVGLAFLAGIVGILGEALGVGVPFWGSLILILFFGVIFLGIAASLLIPRLFPAPLRRSYQRVLDAVQIKHYSPSGFLGQGTMTLVFSYQPFAAAFHELNEQAVIGER
jgi:hypothetical protein